MFIINTISEQYIPESSQKASEYCEKTEKKLEKHNEYLAELVKENPRY